MRARALGAIAAALLLVPAAWAQKDVPELFERYVQAVHALDAKAIRSLCDAESAAIGELVAGPEDLERIRAYATIGHLPEAILQARRNTIAVREGLKPAGREALLEQAIRRRLELAGDEWCRTAEGQIAAVEEMGSRVRGMPPGAVMLKVQWNGVPGETTLIARPSPAGWRFSYYAMCVYVASLLQEMTWVRAENDEDVQGDPRGDPAEILELSRDRSPPSTTPAELAQGRNLYQVYCAECHGDGGRGDSADAYFFDPRPRDFTRGIYKFRSTRTGQLPLDCDLFRTLSRGLPGTGMPAWGQPPHALPQADLWKLVDYIESLSPRFRSPFAVGRKPVEIPAPPRPTREREASGRAQFERLCARCHGTAGRGNGPVAGDLHDEWGDAIRPADLTKPWRYKNGVSMVDIYRTITTGADGTPMPSFGDVLTPDQRWDLAAYLRSIQVQRTEKARTMVRIDDRVPSIPMNPGDPFWERVHAVDVRLTGQMQVPPRLTFPAVDHVRVRVALDATSIAFHLSWNDRSAPASSPATAGAEVWAPKLPTRYGYVSVPQMVERRQTPRVDGIQIQFSPAMEEDWESVPELYGDGQHPVHLWTWKAAGPLVDGRMDGVVTERVSAGTASPPAVRAVRVEAVQSAARYEDGQWRLVLRRGLKATDAARLQFPVKGLIPFAIQAWDGGAGEEGLLSSFSTWYHVQLLLP